MNVMLTKNWMNYHTNYIYATTNSNYKNNVNKVPSENVCKSVGMYVLCNGWDV